MIEELVSEAEWMEALAGLPAFTPPCGPVIMLAPHPDDESLAAGGLLASLASQKHSVLVVAVTDGDAAYSSASDSRLAQIRHREQLAALAVLGISGDRLKRLGFLDRCVHQQETDLMQSLISVIESAGPGATVIAPWQGDFHSDHEAVGRAAEAAAQQTGAALVRWFWWTWHRRALKDVAALPLRKFDLTPESLQLKLAAIAQHRSQLGEGAILPDLLLQPARRPFEVFA